MKKLVCADEIMKAVKAEQKTFFIDENTIVTPSARDVANANGITLTSDLKAKDAGAEKHCCNVAHTEEKTAATNCSGIDKNVVYKVLKAMADSGMLKGIVDNIPSTAPADPPTPYQYEKDASGLKVVRGSTARMDAYFPNDPDKKVYYQELIDKNDSTISSGVLVIDHSTYEWTQNYDENDYVIDGTMVVTINGKSYMANAGDCIFIPNGATVTMGSKDHYCKVYYNTYPSNWADLQ